MSLISFDIILDRFNKTYHQDETINGKLLLEAKHEIKFEGINLWLNGCVTLQTTSKNIGLLETFSNSIKPTTIIHQVVELPKTLKISSGKNEIPFSIELKPKSNKVLYETYHGVFIIIQYLIKCEIRRSMLNRDLQRSLEIIIENKIDNINHFPTVDNKSVMFTITPNTSHEDPKKDVSKFLDFKIVASLDNVRCRLNEPLTGKLTVINSNTVIRSIDLQLSRVETCGFENEFTIDATEVTKVQIADGDVIRNSPIPIYLLFPKLFTCSTLITFNFKIEFELNLIISFKGNYVVKERFGLVLVRN